MRTEAPGKILGCTGPFDVHGNTSDVTRRQNATSGDARTQASPLARRLLLALARQRPIPRRHADLDTRISADEGSNSWAFSAIIEPGFLIRPLRYTPRDRRNDRIDRHRIAFDQNMVRSAKGTVESPGRNVAQAGRHRTGHPVRAASGGVVRGRCTQSTTQGSAGACAQPLNFEVAPT